jgi:hypothetical protein
MIGEKEETWDQASWASFVGSALVDERNIAAETASLLLEEEFT